MAYKIYASCETDVGEGLQHLGGDRSTRGVLGWRRRETKHKPQVTSVTWHLPFPRGTTLGQMQPTRLNTVIELKRIWMEAQ